jgi:hypothetical protein
VLSLHFTANRSNWQASRSIPRRNQSFQRFTEYLLQAGRAAAFSAVAATRSGTREHWPAADGGKSWSIAANLFHVSGRSADQKRISVGSAVVSAGSVGLSIDVSALAF